jgi:hypothetical protein
MIVTDAGRYASSYATECRDCTVRALAVAGMIGYDYAHEILKSYGRINRRRFQTKGLWTKITGSINCRRHGTVARFLRDFPTGRFIVSTRGHALAAIEGVIHDLDADLEERLLASWVIGAWAVKEINWPRLKT